MSVLENERLSKRSEEGPLFFCRLAVAPTLDNSSNVLQQIVPAVGGGGSASGAGRLSVTAQRSCKITTRYLHHVYDAMSPESELSGATWPVDLAFA